MFGRYGHTRFLQSDGKTPFAEHAEALASDFTLVNLETPIDAALPGHASRPGKNRFGAKPETVRLLRDAGVNAVSMANNHAYDLGPMRMLHAKSELQAQGLAVYGAPGIAEHTEDRIGCEEVIIKGTSACLLSVSAKSNVFSVPKTWPKVPYTRQWRLQRVLVPIVKNAAKTYPLVIVFLHWGKEYEDAPSSGQRKTAHLLVDAGAQLVIGHHPHVVQGFERYGRGLIAYSLGNFYFDRSRSNTADGVVARVHLDDRSRPVALTLIPSRIGHHPNVVMRPRGEHATKQLDRIQRLSRALGTSLYRSEDTLVLQTPMLAKKID